jgi:hypothetical protein
VLELPVAAPCVVQCPAILFDVLDDVANFHALAPVKKILARPRGMSPRISKRGRLSFEIGVRGLFPKHGAFPGVTTFPRMPARHRRPLGVDP